MSNETEREESRAALLEMRIDEMEREAPHPCLHVASFCIAWGGEGASASVVHGGWGAMLKAFAESIWVSGDTSHHREEWEEWLEQFADIDEWTADENGEPYCFTSDVGEISQVSIYRLDRAAQAAEAGEALTDEQIVEWAEGFIRMTAFNRSVAIQIAIEAAKFVRAALKGDSQGEKA